jgi:hypothetical protein
LDFFAAFFFGSSPSLAPSLAALLRLLAVLLELNCLIIWANDRQNSGQMQTRYVQFDAKDTQPTPAADDLFDKGDESKLLSKEQAEDFHTCIAK